MRIKWSNVLNEIRVVINCNKLLYIFNHCTTLVCPAKGRNSTFQNIGVTYTVYIML